MSVHHFVVVSNNRKLAQVYVKLENNKLVFNKSNVTITDIARSKECSTLAYEPVKGSIISIGGYEKLTRGKICSRGGEILSNFNGSWEEMIGRVLGRFNESITVLLHNNDLYVLIIGGSTESGPCTIVEVLKVCQSPASEGGWRRMRPLPYGCHSGSLVKVKNRVYLIGGRDGASNGGRVLRHIISLSTGGLTHDTNETWIEESELAEGRYNCGVLVLDNRYIVIIGGYTGVKVLNSIEIYDTVEKMCFTGPSLKYERQRALSWIVETDSGVGIIVYGGDDPVTHRSIVDSAELWTPRVNNDSGWKMVPSSWDVNVEALGLTELNLSVVSSLVTEEKVQSAALFNKDDLRAYSLENTIDLTNTSRWSRNSSLRNGSKKPQADPFHLRRPDGSIRKADVKPIAPSAMVPQTSTETEKGAQSVFTFSMPQWRSTRNSIPSVKRICSFEKSSNKIGEDFGQVTDMLVKCEEDGDVKEAPDSGLIFGEISEVDINNSEDEVDEYSKFSDTLSVIEAGNKESLKDVCKNIIVSTNEDINENKDLLSELELQLAEIRAIRKELAILSKERYDPVVMPTERVIKLNDIPSPSLLKTPEEKSDSSVKYLPGDKVMDWIRSDECSDSSVMGKNIDHPEKCQLFCLSPRLEQRCRKLMYFVFNSGDYFNSMSIRGSWDNWEVDHIGYSIDHMTWIFEIFMKLEDLTYLTEFKFVSNNNWMTDPNLPISVNSEGIANHLLMRCMRDIKPFPSPICEETALQRGWKVEGYEHHAFVSMDGR